MHATPVALDLIVILDLMSGRSGPYLGISVEEAHRPLLRGQGHRHYVQLALGGNPLLHGTTVDGLIEYIANGEAEQAEEACLCVLEVWAIP
jgi:hypothetical protein